MIERLKNYCSRCSARREARRRGVYIDTRQHRKPSGFEADCRRQPEGRDERQRASQLKHYSNAAMRDYRNF